MMRLRRVHESLRGPSASSRLEDAARILACNDSFVLHEPSSSRAVNNLIALQFQRAHERRRLAPGAPVFGIEEFASLQPETVLSAHIGAPLVLQNIVSRIQPPPAVVAIDASNDRVTECRFFRAPAKLVLPDWEIENLVVAAAIVRPGDATLQLDWSGPYRWPEDDQHALRALENMLRDYVDQWYPGRPLWDDPAERLLPEVLDTRLSTSGEPG